MQTLLLWSVYLVLETCTPAFDFLGEDYHVVTQIAYMLIVVQFTT